MTRLASTRLDRFTRLLKQRDAGRIVQLVRALDVASRVELLVARWSNEVEGRHGPYKARDAVYKVAWM